MWNADSNELPAVLKRSRSMRLLRVAYRRAARQLAGSAAKGPTVNMALQGGGALGAFTWGVLDRLSRERGWRFNALSGASAGALNAAVFAAGYTEHGPKGARRALRAFWNEVSQAAAYANFLFPASLMTTSSIWGRAFSDTARGGAKAAGVNPLKGILARHVSIDALRSPEAPSLFVSATNILTGAPRVFTNSDLSIEALLASACLPNIHPTVEIDGTPYWDGGLSANPALRPLLSTDVDKLILVRLLSPGAQAAPRNDREIEEYMRNLIFSRPLEMEIARLRNRFHPALEEIDISQHAQSATISNTPTAYLVNNLFTAGVAAAEAYLTTRAAADVRSESAIATAG